MIQHFSKQPFTQAYLAALLSQVKAMDGYKPKQVKILGLVQSVITMIKSD